MRWIAAPLVGLTVLFASGFVGTLVGTTEASVDLARASRQAPRTTAEAAASLEVLPRVADLTERQADALVALADALDVSAERVQAVRGDLSEQVGDLAALGDTLVAMDPLIGCVRARLVRLQQASRPVADRIGLIRDILGAIANSQRRSIRHMRSINRKLTALGVVATAQGVEAPAPPGEPPPPVPPEGPSGRAC